MKVDKKFYEQIYKEHKKFLHNLDYKNNTKLIICFSGVPKSGKTMIAKKLEKKYRAIRISNDHIRYVVADKLGKKHSSSLMESYARWLFDKFKNKKNKIYILDSSIDRKYKKITKLARGNNFKLFIIRLDISRNVFKQRIKFSKSIKYYSKTMEKYFFDHKKCIENLKSDLKFFTSKKLTISDYQKINKLIK